MQRVQTTLSASDGRYAGGIIRIANVNYPVDDNGTGNGMNLIDIVTSVPLPITNLPVSFEIFEDDFEVNGNQYPTRRTIVDTGNHMFVYDLLQPVPTRTSNRFADAYMQPDLMVLNQFDSLVPATPKIESEGAAALLLKANAGSRPYKSPVFWTAYVSTAFEFEATRDADPNDFEDGVNGGTYDEDDIFELGTLIYLETRRDTHNKEPGTSPDFGDAIARTAVHEVAHQRFESNDPGLDDKEHRPENSIMRSNVVQVPVLDFYFHAQDVRTLRHKWNSR
jgi:hypothetical protein